MKYPDFLLPKSTGKTADGQPSAPARGIARRRLAIGGGIAAAVAVAAFLVLGDETGTRVPGSGQDHIFTSAYAARKAPWDRFIGAAARPMAACVGSARIDCVEDGDTFWLGGDQIRIANIDAPEMESPCADHARLAGEARRTLARLLDRKPISIYAQGRDREGRLLAFIETPAGDVGREMLHWRVVVPWDRHKPTVADWCG